MAMRFHSLLYLCAILATTYANVEPAMASRARSQFATGRVIVAPRFFYYPVLIPFCDYSHAPPVIYNTPCGVWPYC
jgi:hypothetical protein